MGTEDSSLYREKRDDYYEGANPYLLKHIKEEWKEVLDIGCSRGGLGAAIKEKGIRVSGIEAFEEAAQIAKAKLDHVIRGNIETMELPYEKEQFDCIIFGDVLEHLFDPWAVLEKVKPYVKQGGVILTSIPNVAHISVLIPLLNGDWTYEKAGLMDKTHIRFFTFKEMLRLFVNAGFSIHQVERVYVNSDTYTPIIQDLYEVCKKYNIGSNFMAETIVYQYVIEAMKV
ncbi:class I SAM-dependent methyltransferase [Bacillus sp. CGMCC 1.60114]|uniref:class I SAM-dependent methyltransferase n=1 Tax=unclassified Bacillus (in: firmicutes) TaxID=185979 RepID=UPI0036438BDA